MRASMHSGRTGSARHNDRSFVAELSADCLQQQAGHIRLDDMQHNVYHRRDPHKDFRDNELDYYREHYQAALNAQNERYKAGGHPERCKTIEQLYSSPKTRPEEVILQIGNMANHVSLDMLQDCFADYCRWLREWSDSHGGHMHILTSAIHVDEATPHIHMRRVWDAPDKDGNPTLNQSKALKLAGVELPHPDRPEGRYNNHKMSFDTMARQQWHDICRAHGIELETEPIKGVRHRDTQDYALQQHRALQDEQKKTKEAIDMRNRAKSQHKTYTAQNEALRASKPLSDIQYRDSKFNGSEVIVAKDDFSYLMQQTAITETALANLAAAQKAHAAELADRDEVIDELQERLQTQSVADKIERATKDTKLQRYEAAERMYPDVMARLLNGRYQDNDRERDR